MADRGFRSAGHAGISSLRGRRPRWFFSGKISGVVPRFTPGTATAPVHREVLSDIERECEGGNEGLFLGHKSGSALV